MTNDSRSKQQSTSFADLAPHQIEQIGFVEDISFTYDGFQVVRAEYFAHIYEPSITLNQYRLSVNKACLNRLPKVEYVQLLVNPKVKKLVIRPSNEDEKGSFRWCINGKKTPRQVLCRVFFAMIIELMGWNPTYRYKLLGKMVMSKSEYLYVFDLTEPEIYQRLLRDPETGRVIRQGPRRPIYPEEWKNQFGPPIEENRKSLQISIVDGYIMYGLKENHQDCEAVEGSNEHVN